MKKYLVLWSLCTCFAITQEYSEQYERGYKLYREEKFVEAELALKKILLSLDKEQSLRKNTLFFRGKCFLYQGLHRSAISQFNAAMTFEQNDVDILYNRGKAHFFLQDYDRAIDDFTRVIRLYPQSVWALYYRANSYYSANKLALAQSDYERLLELAPRFFRGWIGLAKISYSKGKLRVATRQLQQSLPAKNSETHYYLGIIALHKNKTSTAFTAFSTAVKYNDKDYKSWYELGKIYFQEKKYQVALQNFEKVEVGMKTHDVLLHKGMALYHLQQYTQATETFKRSIEQRESAKAFYYLGLSYQGQEQFDEASFYYTRAIRLSPRLWDAYRERGYCYSKAGKYFQAQQDYEIFISSGKVDYLVFFYRGEIYEKISQYDKALRDYNKCIKLKKDYAPAYAARSFLLWRFKNDAAKALADIEKAIELSPQEADYFNKRATLGYLLGNVKKALADVSQAIKLNEESKYFYNRGMIYRAQEKWENAIADFTTTIRLDPRNANAYHSRGRTYLYTKRFDKAMDDFDKAIALSPQAMFYFHRGRTFESLNMTKEALADYDKAIDLKSEAEFYYAKASILYNMKKFLESLRECNQAITANPDIADYYFLRSEIYKELGNEEDAAVNRAMGERLNDKEY